MLRVLAPLDAATAEIVARILGWLGIAAQRDLATLTDSSGFGYEIAFRCTGVIPAGLLAAAILASGAPLASRLPGAALGVLFIFVVNTIRLVTLFWIGVRFPSFFGVAHAAVWQGLMVCSVVGFFSYWKRCFSAVSAKGMATQRMLVTSH